MLICSLSAFSHSLVKCEVRAKESERLSATGCWILASRMACSGGVRVARKRRSVSEGRGQRARQRRAESSSEDQQRRWTFESRMRI